MKDANRTIRRLHKMYSTDRIERLASIKTINVRRLSRNKRLQKKGTRIKFGIAIPNSVKKALELDRKNKNNLWGDAIIKELKTLEKANVIAFYPPNYNFGKEFQFCPLHMIFDIKQEDLRRKARMVAGRHVINATMYESHSSVVQTRTIRILEIFAMNEGLEFMTDDIGNAFVQTEANEKVYSVVGPEFGDKKGCVIKIQKALYGLMTSAR